jgi:hypothetical protein
MSGSARYHDAGAAYIAINRGIATNTPEFYRTHGFDDGDNWQSMNGQLKVIDMSDIPPNLKPVAPATPVPPLPVCGTAAPLLLGAHGDHGLD